MQIMENIPVFFYTFLACFSFCFIFKFHKPHQMIAAAAGGYELSRVGQQLFIVGSFDDRAVADRLADAIRQADAALEIKVAEIAE